MRNISKKILPAIVIILITMIATFIYDSMWFNKELIKLQEIEDKRDNELSIMEQKYNKAREANYYLVNQITRLTRVASLVERPTRTRIAAKPNTKMKMMTIPPRFEEVDVYEKYIELKPKPHFAERKIDKARWDKIWKCTCPLTCDCWIGKPCSTHGCLAVHE